MRSLSPAAIAALAQKTVSLCVFAEVAFRDNTIYVFSGLGSFSAAGPAYDSSSTFPYGQTFTGLGWLGKVSSIPTTTKVQAQNVSLSLSGIPSSLISEALGQVRIDGTCTVWIGFFTAAGELILDPLQVFNGSLDVPSITQSGQSAEISLACENTLLSLNLAPNHRFDDIDQQLRYPGDLGFSFVDVLANLQLFWPSPFNEDSSRFPVELTLSPNPIYLAVGDTATIEATITYSDSTTYTKPANTGSGTDFILDIASTNPRVATVTYTETGNVQAVGVGECSIMARVPGSAFSSGGGYGPGTVYRAVASVFVHD